MRAALTPARDAALATALVVAAVWAGSAGLEHLDPALLGYLGATLVAAFGVAYRASAAWRRPAAALYARAFARALLHPRTFAATLAAGAQNLGAQRFIARRSRVRWLAHVLLSGGTLASLAITLPLVFGWLHFEAAGPRAYRAVVFGALPALRFAVDGPVGWLVFHGLSLAAVAVLGGAVTFLALRLRAGRAPGARHAFHTAPLLLLVAVAATGLALPLAGRLHAPALFRVAAIAHEAAVVVFLVALPFSKLGHALLRPLALGAQAVRAAGAPRSRCARCRAPLAPSAQAAAVAALLEARGLRFGSHTALCPPCRRTLVAAAQAAVVGADFQPRLTGARPAAPASGAVA